MKKTILALLIVALAVPVLAQQAAPRPKEVVARFLELTPEQVTAWEGLLATLDGTLDPLREQLRDVQHQLAEMLQGENPDPAAVGTLVIQGKELREQMGEAHRVYGAAFEELLTETQVNRLNFIRRAAHVQPIIPAFRLFGLIADPEPPPQ